MTMNDKLYFVHPTAVIDEPCEIGAGTKIWQFCHVMSGARIGERCVPSTAQGRLGAERLHRQ